MTSRLEIRLASFKMSKLDRSPWKLEQHGGFAVIAVDNETGRDIRWTAGPFETRAEAETWVKDQGANNGGLA